MTTHDTPDPHDGWTPQLQEQEQPPVFPTPEAALRGLLEEARVDIQRCRNCGHDHNWHDLRLGFGWCAWGAPKEPCGCGGWGGNGSLLHRIDDVLGIEP
jgi:hypothetical protein